MKALLLIAACAPITFLPFGAQDDERAAPSDREAVTRAALDYVEGFYEVKPELLERSVHENLTKYGFWRESSEEEYRGMAMTYEQALELASHWNVDGHVGDDAPKEVEILDLLDQTACVKLTAAWGIDTMQLAKFDGQWKILHVMWQSHP